MISEAQDASAAARARIDERERMAGHDEPFELFRGFNEIFIVAALIVLFAGIGGFVASLWRRLIDDPAIFKFPPADFQSQFWYGGSALVGMGIAVALAHYFTLRRRMIAPSIILAVIFFASASLMGLAIGGMAFDGEHFLDFGIGAAVATALAVGYHFVFRVPFALALISIGALATALLTAAYVRTSKGNAIPEFWLDLLLLSSEGPFAFITLAFGLVFLTLALRYDLSDPRRITRRADFAFWLHAVAAPSIMHTVAPTLFLQEAVSANLLLFLFVLAMALFAVVINRRSFIISGMGYLVALIMTLLIERGTYITFALILGLGLIFVYLGAKWEVLRCWLMRVLPNFPGKSALPLWELAMADGNYATSGPQQPAKGSGVVESFENVDTGAATRAQAACVVEPARSRNDERGRMSSLDEPFVLSCGFNEIFIAFGLTILGIVWLSLALVNWAFSPNELENGIWAVAGMCGTIPLAWYFTARRRMVAPSIILLLFFYFGAWLMGTAIVDSASGDPYLAGDPFFAPSVNAGINTLLIVGYYCLFRVPFALALVALGFYATLRGATPEFPENLLLLSGEGPFSIAMATALGLVFLCTALVFDMSDPNRVTCRAGCGFWMHIAAALAIANTLSAVLYARDTASAHLLLVLFVLLMALFAVIIDRRSFLVVGVGYIIALFFGLPEDPYSVSSFAQLAGLGLILVYLGANWQLFRRWLMRILPDFPGKNLLPPWDLLSK